MEEHAASGRTIHIYYLMLVLTIAALAMSLWLKIVSEVTIAIPLIVLIIFTIFSSKKVSYIPPIIILVAVVLLWCSIILILIFDFGIITVITNIVAGMVIGLSGLVVAYSVMAEGINKMKVAFIGFTFGVAIYALLQTGLFYVDELLGWVAYDDNVNIIMTGMLTTTIGAAVICFIYYIGNKNGVFAPLIKFLEDTTPKKSETLADLIAMGESDVLEFKSTLRTNLQTDEIDKRMEKSVLKTLVAFMNTDGGVLLVGVSDDGKVTGLDEDTFDNRDKMNLHITNIISSQIGNEFLPFINFKIDDSAGSPVMIFRCEPCPDPVVLNDGKNQEYYVRSGPSSVEIKGIDMINYVKNRGI